MLHFLVLLMPRLVPFGMNLKVMMIFLPGFSKHARVVRYVKVGASVWYRFLFGIFQRFNKSGDHVVF